jgi:hemerythrin-like domain-containing protein
MEFVIYTRTYSIKKARELLGFKPWVDQPWQSQLEAINGSVALYLNEVGPIIKPKASDWAEVPFKLISNTGAKEKIGLPQDHFCVKNSRSMALTHNTIFRALNAIYAQALLVAPGTQDASDMLKYCAIVYDFIHRHHVFEETMYFPDIERATKIPGLMSQNVEQHRKLDAGLERFRVFAETSLPGSYSGEQLRSILESFAGVFEDHMHAEIAAILDLHDKIESEVLKTIYTRMFDACEQDSDIFKFLSPFPFRRKTILTKYNRAAPLVLGCQDTKFLIDDQKMRFPDKPIIALAFVHLVLAARHRSVWRFNPSSQYGRSRAPNIGAVKSKPQVLSASSALIGSLKFGSTLFMLLLVLLGYI